MAATAEAYARLGTYMARRRTFLRLNQNQAALAAGLSSKTWRSAERGNAVRDTTYPGIEDALGWEYGSCLAVLNGGEPKEAAPETRQSEREPLASGEDFEAWEHIVATDLRDAVRDAVLITLPGATAAEINELEQRVEERLRRRLALRRRDTA